MQAERIAAIESDPDLELERIIYERDLQRTRWLIKAYYRTRIRKLEQHVQYYLHHQEYTNRLSQAEVEYAKEYFTCIGRCVVLCFAMGHTLPVTKRRCCLVDFIAAPGFSLWRCCLPKALQHMHQSGTC